MVQKMYLHAENKDLENLAVNRMPIVTPNLKFYLNDAKFR